MKKSPLLLSLSVGTLAMLATASLAFAHGDQERQFEQEQHDTRATLSGSTLCSQDGISSLFSMENRRENNDNRTHDMKMKLDDMKQDKEKDMKFAPGEKALKKYKKSATFNQTTYDQVANALAAAKDTYKSTMDTAKATRKTAVDAAREAFNTTAQNATDTLKTSFCAAQDTATKKAAKEQFKNTMNQAKDVRDGQIKLANETFKTSADAAKKTLKDTVDSLIQQLQ